MNEYDIEKAFRKIEEELIASMIRNLKRHQAEEEELGINWTQWQTEQLKALEKYKIRNQKKFQGRFSDLNKEIEELIREASERGGMEQELEILQAIKDGFKGAKQADAGATAEFFRLNDRKLEALIQATTNDMQKAETAVLRMANDQYRKVIYNAQVYANTGAGTYQKAVDMATKDFLSAGLNCIVYANGARHTLSDYADMAIRTASKRAYLQGEGVKRQEWGMHTVIVNKRGNPCPKCLPFVGKVLIDDVWSGGSKKDGPYPLMSTAVAAGLYHPRCKDSHTTYFPGISTADDKWSKKELAAIGEEYKAEEWQQYAERQAEKYGRLANYSLDKENQKKYRGREEQWKTVAKVSDSGIMNLPDILIQKSVGAKARNYDVLDPGTGDIFHFVEGTRIQNSQVFAGHGAKTPLHEGVAEGLSEQIGGTPSKWQHCKGDGVIDYYGEERQAEVHWFQEETVGKHKFKIKYWLD